MRSKSLLILLSLSLVACQSTELKKPDPEVCQPLVVTVDVPTESGLVKMIDPVKSYWFCVKRSDPNNTQFHRRPKFLEYVQAEKPIGVSATDYKKLNQFEVDGTKYIENLQKKLDECNAAKVQTLNQGTSQ